MFMRFRAILHLGLSLIAVALSGRDGRAQPAQPTEYQLKAAFLFNFAKFVEWPQQSFTNKTSPLVIGVLGENPFPDLPSMLKGKFIDDHPLKVVEIKEFSTTA